jgi:colanic acid biosynthesis glycosyl transferase WcaI
LCSADIHILFQKPEVIDTVMPSKVLGMMASARPSIIIANDKSEIKPIILESGAGLFFSEYSDNLIQDLEQLISNKEDFAKLGNKARNYVIDNFSKEKILTKMLKKLQEL